MNPPAVGAVREPPLTAGRVTRFALIGASAIARRSFAPALASVPGARLEVVASLNADRRRELAAAHGAREASSYEAALDDPDVDAVYISLPNALHEPWSLRALAAGKHVYCEKPATLSLEGAERMCAAARARQLAFFGGFMFLFHPQHEQARQAIESGLIGEPRHYEGWFGIPPLDQANVRLRAALGGGALNDAAGYPLLAGRLLLRAEPAVVAGRLYRHEGCEVDERGSALLAFPGGQSGQVTFGFGFGYRNAYGVWGSEGQLTLERAFSVPPDHSSTLTLRDRDGREERRSLPAVNQFGLAIQAFVEAARGRRPFDSFLEDFVAGARLLAALRRVSPLVVLPAEQKG